MWVADHVGRQGGTGLQQEAGRTFHSGQLDAPSAVVRSARRDAQLAHQCRYALAFGVNCGTHQRRSALGFG